MAVSAALRLLKLPGRGRALSATYALKAVNDGLTHATAKPNRDFYFSGTWQEEGHPGYEIKEVFSINFAAVICQLLSCEIVFTSTICIAAKNGRNFPKSTSAETSSGIGRLLPNPGKHRQTGTAQVLIPLKCSTQSSRLQNTTRLRKAFLPVPSRGFSSTALHPGE